jgi:hypothetical protein
MALEYFEYTGEAAKGPRPAIIAVKQYVLRQWGGMHVGDFGVRNKRGGTSLSVHAYGAAWDWRYAGAPNTPGRAAADEVIQFLIEHHAAIGVQAVHDYTGNRIWRCSRPGQGSAWKQQKGGSGDGSMGAPWAQWLHIEIHPSADGRSIEDKLSGAVPPRPNDVPPVAAACPAPTLKLGTVGPTVAELQDILRMWGHDPGRSDGRFGPQTAAALKGLQAGLARFGGGPADGIYGPRTAAAYVVFLNGLTRAA